MVSRMLTTRHLNELVPANAGLVSACRWSSSH